MNVDDKRLIECCLDGQIDAFGELVRRYQDRLYNAIYRVVNNPEDAQDVVQESFLNAFQSLNSFKGDSEFFTWLYRIAFNSAISLRRRKRFVVSLDGVIGNETNLEPEDHSDSNQPGDDIERDEKNRKIHIALQRLSPEHRIVLVLKDLEGQKYEDIAAILDVPIGTIRSRLHRARLELRELLEKDGI